LKLDKSDTKTAQKKAGDAFVSGLKVGMAESELKIRTTLNNAVESPVWGPFSPKHDYISQGGQPRGSGLRSLVDTGRLKSSLVIDTKFLQTKGTFQITYTAPYAAITHYGGVIQPYGNPNVPSVVLPARPWVQYSMLGGGSFQPLNLQGFFDEAITAQWNS